MENPFEAPQLAQSVQSSGARPVSATLFGVLNIVFALFGFCGNIFGSIFLIVIAYDMIPNLKGTEFLSNNPSMNTINIVNMILGTILTIILLMSGIGLLKFKPWGRSLANFYSVCSLVLLVLALVAHVVFVFLPLVRNEVDLQGQDEAALMGGAIGGFLGACIGVIYPILLLVFMNRRAFREQIGG